MQRSGTPVSRSDTWPGRRLRTVLLPVTAGSVFGLVFGLGSLNRPLLNGVTFYVVGALLAGMIAGLTVLATRSRRRASPSRSAEAPSEPRRPQRPGPRPAQRNRR